MTEKKLSYACPLCNSKAQLLKGSSKSRYFCINCTIEFVVSSDSGQIRNVYEIGPNGDLDEIKDWQEFVITK